MTDKPSIEFQIYDWVEDHFIEENEEDNENQKKYQVGEYIINVFGRTAEGKSVYAKVLNFTPYFYIELPEKWYSYKNSKIKDKLKALKEYLIGKFNNKIWFKFKSTLIDIDYIPEAKKADGFTNENNFKFARLKFNNSEGMKKFRVYFEENEVEFDFEKHKFKTYEANLPPMFRCFHIRNITGCSWVETSNYTLIKKKSLKESHCDIEINLNWKDLNHLKKDINAPLRIASFDIECFSHDGQFPQANRKQDAVIQIGITYTYLGQSEPYRQYIGCLKETLPFDDITDIRSFETETDLILDFKREIIEHDCDIITGYNMFYFDEKYIWDRCVEILEIKDDMTQLSKLKNKICNFKEMKLASSALGENLLRFWDTPGRVHIDLMKDVQKTFTLPSFKLDFVASNFIKGEILLVKDFNKSENKKLVKKYIKNDEQVLVELNCILVDDICLMDYIHLESVRGFISDEVGEKCLVVDINKEEKKLIIVASTFLLNDLKLAKDSGGGKVFWSQAKDDVGPKEIFKSFKGSAEERSIVAKYCIKDCKLVNLLINKLEIVTKNIEMANVCSVPLSYLFIRGQGIKIFSLVLKEYKEQGYIFPVIKMNKPKLCKDCNIETTKYSCPQCKGKKLDEIESDDWFEGAIVFDPVAMVDYEANVTKDYNSLYPSAIIQKNMSHETIVEKDEYDNLPGIKYYNAQYVESDGTIQYRRYAQKNNKLGVIPLILDKLLKERKAVKKQMEAEESPFKKKILDAKQLALKVTANSLYGQLGAATSPVCKKDIAACTTSTGREMLILGKKYDEEILPGLLNGMKKALEKEDDEMFNKFLDLELKNRTNTQFVDGLKKYLLEDLKDKTIQPVVRYGDTDSNFSCYRIRENLEKVGKKESLELWKEIINFSKELIKPFMPEDIQDKWVKLHEKYYDINKIKKLELPDGPEVQPEPNHWKIILPIEERLKQYLKEYMEESYLSWLWTLQEITMRNFNNIDYKLFKWGIHQMNKIKLIGEDLTDEKIKGYTGRIKQIDTELKKINERIKKNNKEAGNLNIEEENTNIETLTQERMKHQKEYNDISVKRQTLEIIIKNFSNDILKDYWIQPYWYIRDNKKVFKVEFYKGGNSITDKRSLDLSMELGKISGELIRIRLPFPHNFAYEKTFWPFLILCKKKYVGNKYEDNPNKFKQDFMGIVLKRRDNAPIVKEICGGIINLLINKKDPAGAKDFLKKSLDNMFEGKYDIKYFLQSRTLKMKESYKNWERIGHVFLADKIAIRDPGNKPQSGDRIEFAVIKVVNEDPKKKLLQGELIETPAYIKQNNKEIDYLFYMTNQIQNPATQFLELVDKNIGELFNEYIEKYGPPKKEKIVKEIKIEPKEKKPRVPRKKIVKVEKIIEDDIIKNEIEKIIEDDIIKNEIEKIIEDDIIKNEIENISVKIDKKKSKKKVS